MAGKLNLADISKGKAYQIAGFADSSSEYSEILLKMGFVEGTKVELAPVKISDPIVYQIRGSRIALRKVEAKQILVKEAENA